MNNRQRIPSLDDHYCQVCSTSSNNAERRLSCFSCDHCRVSMCYDCFEKHTNGLIEEYTQLQARFTRLTDAMENKRQFLLEFQEHCIRDVNTTYDEILQDLQNLRHESIQYVQQQFNDAEIVISEMLEDVNPLIMKSQQQWAQDGISKNAMIELEKQRKQVAEIEHRLDVFASPNMQIKMATYPRNKLDLLCQVLTNTYSSTKKFSYYYPGRAITKRCNYRQGTDSQNGKIALDTEVEEFLQHQFATRQVQTDPARELPPDSDDEFNDPQDPEHTGHASDRIHKENCLSTRFTQQGSILTQNEVDRVASDGETLLYYSETSRSLCYITEVLSSKQANGISITREISCRWPHHPILDLIYSPGSSQFVCATKNGIYTVSITKQSTIDFHLQLTQVCSYVRLAADKNYIWLWTDTPRANLLRTYSPKTFTCIKIFNLHDYPRFLDNSTSFCVHSNIIATLFQFKTAANDKHYQKDFHLTFCDSVDLHELCTVRLGTCEVDHEIRVNQNGLFFITNGKRKLWIVDQHGKKEYIHLLRTGRALTIHQSNQVVIANGTQQLQCVELSQDPDGFH